MTKTEIISEEISWELEQQLANATPDELKRYGLEVDGVGKLRRIKPVILGPDERPHLHKPGSRLPQFEIPSWLKRDL